MSEGLSSEIKTTTQEYDVNIMPTPEQLKAV